MVMSGGRRCSSPLPNEAIGGRGREGERAIGPFSATPLLPHSWQRQLCCSSLSGVGNRKGRHHSVSSPSNFHPWQQYQWLCPAQLFARGRVGGEERQQQCSPSFTSNPYLRQQSEQHGCHRHQQKFKWHGYHHLPITSTPPILALPTAPAVVI